MMLGKGAPIRKRVAGRVLAALSLFSAKERTLLKELKIDALLKVENPSFSLNRGNQAHFTMGAEQIGSIGPFPLGKAALKDEQTIEQFRTLGHSLEQSPAHDKAVLVILIGSADRQRLHGALQSTFDSNVGLAQARAEWVRKQLLNMFPGIVGQFRFLLLTSGPKKTEGKMSAEAMKEDRIVEIWALWGGSSDEPLRSTKRDEVR